LGHGRVAAIVPAAGHGVRMGGKKQFLLLQGVPILVRTLRQLAACRDVDDLYVAAPQEDVPEMETLLAANPVGKAVSVIAGGERRQDSVENCLRALPADTSLVAVHDAVRPFATPELISSVLAEAARSGAAIPGVLCVDTVKQVQRTRITATIPRERIVLAQTPQAFHYAILRRAFDKAREDSFLGTDEASLVEHLGLDVVVVAGSQRNIKITTPADLRLAEFYLQNDPAETKPEKVRA
jgi:2-C-methyl-D-erythritol 4-phosphate cytidylyltransferase